ncbi:MAG: SIR2 family protein [Sulfitobacter sp.]
MTNKNPANSERQRVSTFDSQMAELHRWPYVSDAVNNTLDLRLIEGRGRQFLYQALSNNKLMAFVGSGISSGYGRLSWSKWLELQFEQISEHADFFLETSTIAKSWLSDFSRLLLSLNNSDVGLTDKAQKHLRRLNADIEARFHVISLQQQRVSQLYDTFKAIKSEGGKGLGGEQPPIRFQVAEQLHDLLRASRSSLDFAKAREPFLQRLMSVNPYIKPPPPLSKMILETSPNERDSGIMKQLKSEVGFPARKIRRDSRRLRILLSEYAVLAASSANNNTFQDNAKRLLIDEVAAANQYLLDGFRLPAEDLFIEEDKDLPPHTTLRRDFLLLRDEDGAKRYNVLRYFRSSLVKKLADDVAAESYSGQTWKNIATIVSEECDANISRKREFISPTHRFMVAALASLMPESVAKEWVDKLQKGDDDESLLRALDVSDYNSRHATIDESLDPLKKMIDDLGIKQLLTTNYDFEIERLFTDRGYLRFEHPQNLADPDNLRIDGSGGRFADLSYRRERAADLTTFALGQNGSDAGVFHLHGRATESSKLVITERDYMNLYVRDDEFRETSDEAIQLAFSASPILFVGLGMSEADVLRPLRQFMSDRRRDNQRWAFTLLPAEGERAERESAAATLYIRYGAHAIFYGSCFTCLPDETAGDPQNPAEFDWMHHVFNLLTYLKSAAKARKEIVRLLSKEGGLTAGERAKLQELADNPKLPELNPFYYDLETADAAQKRSGALTRALGSFTIAERGIKSAPFCVTQKLTTGKCVSWGSGMMEPISKALWRGDLVSDVAVLSRGRKPSFNLEVKDDAELGFERQLIAELIKLEISVGGGTDRGTLISHCNGRLAGVPFEDGVAQSLKALEQDYSARLHALDGVRGAIYTGAFAATMDLIKQDKDEWRAQWRASPPHRQARIGLKWETTLNSETTKPCPNLPLTYIRHEFDAVLTDLNRAESRQIENKHLPLGQLPDDETPFQRTEPTGVRTFDDFISAVQVSPIGGKMSIDPLPNPDPRGTRRLFVVAAQRGIGKGTFLSAFTTTAGLAQYVISSWPESVCWQHGIGGPPRYLSAVFLNLSFSTEIASTFDALVDAVIDALAMLELKEKYPNLEWDECQSAAENFLMSQPLEGGMSSDSLAMMAFGEQKCKMIAKFADLPRSAKLHVMLKTFAGKTAGLGLRLLLVVSAAELYFAPTRRTKNGEIRAWLELLFGPEIEQVPIDIIMIGNDKYLGPPVLNRAKRNKKNLRLKETLTDNVEQPEKPYLPLVRADIGMNGLVAQAAAEKKLGVNFADFATRPETYKYDAAEAKRLAPGTPFPCAVFIPRPMSAHTFLIDNFEVLAGFMYLKHMTNKDEEDGPVKELLNDINTQLKSGNPKIVRLDQLSPKECYSCRGLTEKNVVEALRRAVFAVHNATAKEEAEKVDIDTRINGDHEALRVELRKILLRRYKVDKPAFREWRQIREILRGSRFCLTVILACAERITLLEESIVEGAEAAETFIRATIDSVSTVSASGREQAAIGMVIDTYGSVHDRSIPQRNVELLQLILRHLAVIGSPTSLDVLVRAPEIRRYFDTNRSDSHRPRTAELFEAMTALVLRGLVFRINPHPRLKRLDGQINTTNEALHTEIFGDRVPELEARYSLHRLTQTHILRKMGAESIEFGENNTFAPSLYASMSSQLPRLSFESFSFLQRLVSSFSQYPDAVQKRYPETGVSGISDVEALAQQGWVFHQAPEVTRVQALRAALSIVRATFSVAVVSRFDDYSKEPSGYTGERSSGFFETYRVQIRWIIRKAWELLREKENEDFDIQTYQPDRDDGFSQLNTCYRDEIVWLYNECGVVSLVQGHVLNAVSLLRQALRLNAHADSDQPGTPNYNRIALNLAIAQIDRGRLDAAHAQLASIRTSEDENNAGRKEVWLLATGYLGLVEFLKGRDKIAVQHFRKATKGLGILSELRASAIFARHWGDLLSAQGRPVEALAKMSESLGYSETGGHEDIHRKTLLAIIKVERRARLDKGQGTISLGDELARIKKVQAYADAMEMPTLSCEAKIVRARLLLDQGETVMSGKLLISAMSEASNNDLQLRLNQALTDYAELLILRNDPRQAERVMHFSLALAKQHGNRVAIGRIEQLFYRL